MTYKDTSMTDLQQSQTNLVLVLLPATPVAFSIGQKKQAREVLLSTGMSGLQAMSVLHDTLIAVVKAAWRNDSQKSRWR